MHINIYELADAFRNIENDFDEHRYVDKRDGKIHEFHYYGENLEGENIVPFPGKYEFRAYDVMEDFAQLQSDIGKCNQLMQQIGGKGTFRRFRETAERLGLMQEWCDYEDKAWLDFTMRWCYTNDVDFEPKQQEFSYRSAGLGDLELVTNLHCKLYAYDGVKAVGVAQVSLRREYIEGAGCSPVGYLEAVFVESDYRRKNIGYKLVFKCRKWAVSYGCFEFASDCELDNSDSYKFHISIGFKEVSRNVHFISDLHHAALEMSEENEN